VSLLSSFSALRDKLMEQTFAEFVDQSGIIRDNAVSVYNPETGANVISFAISITAATYLRNYNQHEISGEIQSGDVEIIVSGKDATQNIKPSAKVFVGSSVYDVISATPVPKKNQVIQRLHCRGAGNE
jgi:hypothetical protein